MCPAPGLAAQSPALHLLLHTALQGATPAARGRVSRLLRRISAPLIHQACILCRDTHRNCCEYPTARGQPHYRPPYHEREPVVSPHRLEAPPERVQLAAQDRASARQNLDLSIELVDGSLTFCRRHIARLVALPLFLICSRPETAIDSTGQSHTSRKVAKQENVLYRTHRENDRLWHCNTRGDTTARRAADCRRSVQHPSRAMRRPPHGDCLTTAILTRHMDTDATPTHSP